MKSLNYLHLSSLVFLVTACGGSETSDERQGLGASAAGGSAQGGAGGRIPWTPALARAAMAVPKRVAQPATVQGARVASYR